MQKVKTDFQVVAWETVDNQTINCKGNKGGRKEGFHFIWRAIRYSGRHVQQEGEIVGLEPKATIWEYIINK